MNADKLTLVLSALTPDDLLQLWGDTHSSFPLAWGEHPTKFGQRVIDCAELVVTDTAQATPQQWHHLARFVNRYCPGKAALAARSAADMSWAEIDADIDAERECLAITKARVMVEAGRVTDHALTRILCRLRAPMQVHGFFSRVEGGITAVRQSVHEGMLLELAAAGGAS